MEKLISLSKDWEVEDSCYGYRANEKADIDGNRVFLAEENGEILGYLFGKMYKAENMKSIIPDETPYFEVEELFVVSSRRSKGIGSALFRYAENILKTDTDYILLSTATKNYKAVLNFYLDELDMNFWSARLFKKIK